MTTSHKTFCRYCHAYCPMVAEVENGKVLSVKPDTDNEMYGGYTCIKGRQLVEQMYQPQRLTKCRVKNADGEFVDISSEEAMDQIAEKVKAIVDEHGPDAIATYNGTVAFQNSGQLAYSREWHNALGSNSYYTSVTIDQPAKVFVGSRIGYWTGGGHFFHDSDVSMIIGNNPIASHYAPPGGVPSVSPSAQLRKAQNRGLKLIAIDPRKTELAGRADLHLQIKPGEDSTLLAGMIKIILEENLYDADFCDQFTSGLDELREQVAPYDLASVAARTDIPEDAIAEAARLFAAGPRGTAITGTGPEMGSHPNLTQHLVASLNIICGRFYRAGDTVPNPGALAPDMPKFAQVYESPVAWGQGVSCRVRPEYGELVSPAGVKEMPCSQLADEILTPGEGQVKALFVIAGNPVMAWPDQRKAYAAMQELDLLVCIDPYLSATSEMSDYLFGPKLTLEREDVTLLADPWYEKPYSHYSKAVVETDNDVIEEWELYWGLAKRLNLDVQIKGKSMPIDRKPTKFELLQAITKGSRVDLGFLRDNPGGHIFEEMQVEVQPTPESAEGRLKLFPGGVAEEFQALAETAGVDSDYTHTLIGYRSKYVLNSFGRNLPEIEAKSGTTNPANLHPDDLAELGIEDDSEVVVHSKHGSIPAIVKANAKIKPGVLAMHHCWGTAPGQQAPVREVGSNTNLLVNAEEELQPFTGMTRSSGIPVRITQG
ncbi:MAG: molybdopterin-dependent oxidoreductase [Gammaproteobacteria bacterium]|nr:molybdopterin-dependent oxidoreductase [Gammaproteobacteria bacterium]MBT4493107.1 molybdopterin-dependent oxidoreductase [Gammaproteobacteria bacterium]MBT7371687.1 molybdopterin-dependent oxidoreductase [Gammaproteobacteria bacterium]